MRLVRTWAALMLIAVASCGGDDATAGPFELTTSPEFVNMVIPGHRPVALVSATSDDGGEITLAVSTSMDGATVEVLPDRIEPGAVAEIWIELPEVSTETPLDVTIEGRRDVDVRTATINATAMPGTDDLAPTALDIAAVFLDELGGSVPGLPATTDELTNGTPVAGLLVVTHYAWFTDDAEIGLAWHVMVAPDDWSELTIRPRDEFAPTRAFRLTSWSTALGGGPAEIVEIDPPPEVTR